MHDRDQTHDRIFAGTEVILQFDCRNLSLWVAGLDVSPLFEGRNDVDTGLQVIGTLVPRTYRHITQCSGNRRRGTDFSDRFRPDAEAIEERSDK